MRRDTGKPDSPQANGIAEVRGGDLPANLPEMAGRIIALIGAGAAERFLRQYGGRRVYLPVKPGPDHLISQAIGQDAALLIGQHIGPGTVDIPRAASWIARLDVCRLYDDGVSQRQIAARLKISERHVGRLLSGYRGRPRHKNGTDQPAKADRHD